MKKMTPKKILKCMSDEDLLNLWKEIQKKIKWQIPVLWELHERKISVKELEKK
jgi:hypothetical protein